MEETLKIHNRIIDIKDDEVKGLIDAYNYEIKRLQDDLKELEKDPENYKLYDQELSWIIDYLENESAMADSMDDNNCATKIDKRIKFLQGYLNDCNPL